MSAQLPENPQGKVPRRVEPMYWATIIAALIGAAASIVAAIVSANAAVNAATAAKTEVSVEVAPQLLPVGSIIASVLSPEDFKAKAGRTNWEPCEGQPAPEEFKLATHERSSLPDLRGLYLRGLNVFSPGSANPQSPKFADPTYVGEQRKAGEPQQDAISFTRVSADSGGSVFAVVSNFGGDPKEVGPRNAGVYYYCKVR